MPGFKTIFLEGRIFRNWSQLEMASKNVLDSSYYAFKIYEWVQK